MTAGILLFRKEKVAPDDLDPDIVVIQQPVQNIYSGGFGGYGYVCVSDLLIVSDSAV